MSNPPDYKNIITRANWAKFVTGDDGTPLDSVIQDLEQQQNYSFSVLPGLVATAQATADAAVAASTAALAAQTIPATRVPYGTGASITSSANLTYDPATGLFAVGTGGGAAQGWYAGPLAAAISALWGTDVVPGAANYTLAKGGGYGNLNGATGTKLQAAGVDLHIAAVAGNTQPKQPAFLAYQSATQNNKTGNGTVYTVLQDTEVFDRGANFNPATGIFTAPIAGIYQLEATVYVTGCTIATVFQMAIVTTARSYLGYHARPAGANDAQVQVNTLADMAAGDTAKVTILVAGEAADTDDIVGAAGNAYTRFSGTLIA